VQVVTGGSRSKWTHILAGGEHLQFFYLTKSGNFEVSFVNGNIVFCSHSSWEAEFHVKMNFLDPNGISRLNSLKKVKLKSEKNQVHIEALRIDTISTVVAGNTLIQLEIEISLKEMKRLHKNYDRDTP
ncbi:hypothetical protein PFISCL1PPCAC_17856, partial [Pristionchus fissidentatus]